MSVWADTVFQVRSMPANGHATEKTVLLHLAMHANPELCSRPGEELLADETGLTTRSVRSALKSLRAFGLIEPVQGGHGPSGKQEYRLTPEGKAFPVKPERASGSKPEPVSGQTGKTFRFKPETDSSQTGNSRQQKSATSFKELKSKEEQVNRAQARARGTTLDRKSRNAAIARLFARYCELFARPPDEEWARRELGSRLTDGYAEDSIRRFLESIGARNPQAVTTGRYVPLHECGALIEEWLMAGEPDVFPRAVVFKSTKGEDRGKSGRSSRLASEPTGSDGFGYDEEIIARRRAALSELPRRGLDSERVGADEALPGVFGSGGRAAASAYQGCIAQPDGADRHRTGGDVLRVPSAPQPRSSGNDRQGASVRRAIPWRMVVGVRWRGGQRQEPHAPRHDRRARRGRPGSPLCRRAGHDERAVVGDRRQGEQPCRRHGRTGE